MHSGRSLLLVLLALCACALGLAACGGDDAESGDASAILDETFGAGKDVKSGRLELSFRLNAQGLQNINGPIGVRLSGPFQSVGKGELPKFDFQASLDAGGQALTAGAVSTGEKGFVKFQDQAYVLSDELYEQFKKGYAEQAKCSEERGDEGVSFRSLGIDPGKWLTNPQTAGTEDVGGTTTTHITAGVDVPKLLDDVNRVLGRTDAQQADPCADEQPQEGQPKEQGSRQLSEEDRKQIAEAVKDARVDVWTGEDDRILRRINVTLRFEVPEESRESARGLRSGDLRFDMTIGALNEKQTITAPENARPLEELTGALTAGGAAQPGTGGGAAQPEQQPQGEQQPSGSKYEQCLADAGQDVEKLQDCGQLIGQ
jgi:hypothetical protein